MTDDRFDRAAFAVIGTFVAIAVGGLAVDASALPRQVGRSQPDHDWTDLPEALVEDVLPAPLVHDVGRLLPDTHPHHEPPPPTFAPRPLPRQLADKPAKRASGPVKTDRDGDRPKLPAKPQRGRHRAPKPTRTERHAYAVGMAYQVLAQGLHGRTRFEADGIPGVLGFLASHGLTDDHDSIRKTLADFGEWRGMIGDGAGALTVHITSDNHG